MHSDEAPAQGWFVQLPVGADLLDARVEAPGGAREAVRRAAHRRRPGEALTGDARPIEPVTCGGPGPRPRLVRLEAAGLQRGPGRRAARALRIALAALGLARRAGGGAGAGDDALLRPVVEADAQLRLVVRIAGGRARGADLALAVHARHRRIACGRSRPLALCIARLHRLVVRRAARGARGAGEEVHPRIGHRAPGLARAGEEVAPAPVLAVRVPVADEDALAEADALVGSALDAAVRFRPYLHVLAASGKCTREREKQRRTDSRANVAHERR